jgi:hypothetical protein
MTQADRIKKAVGEFGDTAKAKLNQGGQPEDQLRNPIEQLFAALSAECGHAAGAVVLVGEKSLSDLRTRPDFAVQRNKALIGFIEVKAPGKGADPRKFKDTHDKEQWDKLKALPNLLYIDGNALSLWRNGSLVGAIVKFEGDVETSGTSLGAPHSLLPLVEDFLSWHPIPPKGPKELAATAARLCRFLRDEVIEQLGIKNAKLSDLKEDWKALLFPDADDAKFADGYAQAVTFGLLMAKSRKLTLADGLDDVAKALGKTDTLIGTALRLLTEQDLSLGPSLDTMVRVLDKVDWDVIAKGDPEAWLYFYEDFLEITTTACASSPAPTTRRRRSCRRWCGCATRRSGRRSGSASRRAWRATRSMSPIRRWDRAPICSRSSGPLPRASRRTKAPAPFRARLAPPRSASTGSSYSSAPMPWRNCACSRK